MMAETDERAERLAAALRENLKKRKARARGSAAEPGEAMPSEVDSPSPGQA